MSSWSEEILTALADRKNHQKDIAELYAKGILSLYGKEPITMDEVMKVHEAIVARWSWTGLLRVKGRAWQIASPDLPPTAKEPMVDGI